LRHRAGSGDATGAAVAAPSAVAAALEKPAVAADNAVHGDAFSPRRQVPNSLFWAGTAIDKTSRLWLLYLK